MTKLTPTQQVRLRANFKNDKGGPATVDDVPLWETDNPDVLHLVPGDDGLTCLARATGPLTDSVKVTCTGDADLGTGVREVVLSYDLAIVAAEATGGEIEADEPEEQPAEGL